ncbi:MAG: hypothetical protein K2I23_06870, partial [Clostridia bacterium]|nr:hypothetical protein [Clostridia bacterium]
QFSNSTEKAFYSIWGNDTLWLPSISETGVTGEEGIWKGTTTTRANDTTSCSRSCYDGDYYSQWTIESGGNSKGGPRVTTAYAVRPAFHLNLKRVAETLAYDEPTKITAVYNGDKQTLATLDKEKISWYRDDFADPSKVSVQYMTPAGQILAENNLPKTVGNYKIRLTIIDNSGKYEWWNKDEDPKLYRDADFEITPKPVTIDWDPDPDANNQLIIPKITSEVYTDDNVSLVKIYSGRSNKNGNYPNVGKGESASKMPEYVGEYNIKVTGVNNSNYALAETGNITEQAFTLDTRKIVVPTVDNDTKYYNGSRQSFEINFANNNSKGIIVSVPNELKADNKISYMAAANIVSTAKDVFDYYLVLTLEDQTETQWSTPDENGSYFAPRNVYFHVKPATIGVKFYDDYYNESLTYTLGDGNITIWMELLNPIPTGHEISVDIYGQRNGVDWKFLEGVELNEDTYEDGSFEIELDMTEVSSFDLEGEFVLTVKMQTGDGSSNNFQLEPKTSFVITSEKASDTSGKNRWRILNASGKAVGSGSASRLDKDTGITSANWTEDKKAKIIFDGATNGASGYKVEFTPATILDLEVDTSKNISDGWYSGYRT